MIRLSSRSGLLLAAGWILLVAAGPCSAAQGFDLTPAQRARLQKFLPHTLDKLDKREPVHALIVGDSVTEMTVHSEDDSNTLKSFPGVFLGQIADQFYYTGGLRVVRPKRGKPEKELDSFGQEITVQNASRGDRMMIHAMNVLEAVAWRDHPDLVLVSFGINDAISGASLGTYRRAAQDAVRLVKRNNADLILVGATPTLTDPPERGLAITRPYVDTLREVAQEAGVFFADLGDISWLVRVDEPMRNLEPPAPGKPKVDGGDRRKDPGGGAPTSSPAIQFPFPEELDPDPDKRAMRLFHQVATNLRRWFDHGGTVDLIHPNTAMHRLLGRRLFTELLDGPRDTPWRIGPATARLIDSLHCEVSFRVENTTGSTLRLNLLPLITNHWKPKDAETQIQVEANRKRAVTVSYERTGQSPDAFSPHEPLLRLPVMVLANEVARIEDLRARLETITMHWNLGAQFNQEGGVTVSGRIANNSPASIAGKWNAEWLGQKFSGDFKAAPGSDVPVEIHVKLPLDNTPVLRQRGTLAFAVATEKLTLQFPRTLEIIQNIGLKQTVPLLGKSQYEADKPAPPPMPGPTQPGATFKVDADPKALYLTWDMHGVNLVDNSLGIAVIADINLDARSYGKRLGHGVTESLRVAANAADNPGTVGAPKAWAFGNGYAIEYDRALSQAMLSSRPDGSRRLTLMLPRSLFHLHEWALGNGNSELGINTRLDIWQPPDNKNPQGGYLSFSLFENGLHRDDAESLAALELTPQPTRRWTAHFY